MAYLKLAWTIITYLPKVYELIKAFIKMKREMEYKRQVEENARIRQEVENAKTEQEAQDALNAATRRFNRK
jgi:hypothetical protein